MIGLTITPIDIGNLADHSVISDCYNSDHLLTLINVGQILSSNNIIKNFATKFLLNEANWELFYL